MDLVQLSCCRDAHAEIGVDDFTDWWMGDAPGTKQLVQIQLRYGLRARYEPRMISTGSARPS